VFQALEAIHHAEVNETPLNSLTSVLEKSE